MRRCSSAPRRAARAFTLIELAVAMLVLAALLTTLALPLAAQVQLRRGEETRRQLEEAREALLGFAAVHGRLPCPATGDSRGLERFAPGADAASGACETFHAGYLPAATLGLAPVDAEGFARDAWTRRIRYAVFGGAALGGVPDALTRAGGMQAAGLAALAAAPHFLFVCADGAAAHAAGCGPAAAQLTRRAAFVLVSAGPNGGEPPRPGGDEARNADGDAVFVAREASAAAGREFDDLVSWTSIHLLASRLVTAGRLP